ncbi:MAG: hypothetical protein D6702_11960 [Planctomycetota bacterium]|nr:MAG: hypothetical protein D6702_11960 [Planctomycetota bacterium]
MDSLLLVLLLLSLAGGAASLWWLRGRLRRLEERLDALEILNLVPDRLQALARVIERLDPERLRTEIEGIRAALARVEDLVAVPAVVEQEAPEPDPATVVRAVVRRYLREEGYEAVNVLSPDEELTGERCEVRVECRRRGLRILGSVTLEEGRVVATDLSPSYTMFP